MSKHPTFTSGDFALVPRALSARAAETLVHTDVLGAHETVDLEFSRQRHHFVRAARLPSQVVSLTIGRLEPGESTRRHRHNYETIIYFLAGSGMSVVEGQEVRWAAGDAIYVPVWAWHQHVNASNAEPVEYVACENAPMLQNLGIAVREEDTETY